jgi:hypothetical protein
LAFGGPDAVEAAVIVSVGVKKPPFTVVAGTEQVTLARVLATEHVKVTLPVKLWFGVTVICAVADIP